MSGPNGFAPVRIFIGSGEASRLERKVLIRSLRKTASVPLDIRVFNGTHNALEVEGEEPVPVPLPLDFKYANDETEFTLHRFLVPELCGYRGRAIYMDSDVLCFADVAQLLADLPHDADLLALPRDVGWRTSVAVINCETVRFPFPEIRDEIAAGRYTVLDFLQLTPRFLEARPLRIAPIDPRWNSLDRLEPDTKILHFTDLMRQPWKHRGHPHGALWLAELREAIGEGVVTPDDLSIMKRRSYVRQDLLDGNTRLECLAAEIRRDVARKTSQVRARLGTLRRRIVDRPRLEARDDAFWALFPHGARIRRPARGFVFTEGPAWMDGLGLLFTDIPRSTIHRLDGEGAVSIFRRPSGYANGLTTDREGRLIACEGGARRVTRTETDGSITVLAERFDGKRLNSPNDVVVASDGAVWFTDPPLAVAPEARELPFAGVYRIPPSARTPVLVDDALEEPNGLAFSLDESVLYVGDSASSRRGIHAFGVTERTTLADRRVFVNMRDAAGGPPDGMRIDCYGNLFATGPGGVWVVSKEGKHLGTIRLPEVATNCTFGGADGRTLFVTATTSVFAVETTSGKPA